MKQEKPQVITEFKIAEWDETYARLENGTWLGPGGEKVGAGPFRDMLEATYKRLQEQEVQVYPHPVNKPPEE